VELVHEVPYAGVRALLDDPQLVLLSARTSAHPQLHMRVDTAPFDDVRVRRAIALLVDRDALMESLFDFQADAGNDAPLAPVFPTTDPEVPQRSRDVPRARALLREAGHEALRLELTVPRTAELPLLAQALVPQLAEGGVTVTVAGVDEDGSVDTPFGLTHHGHRATPNAVLAATLMTDGPANLAHYSDPQVDELVRQYDGALTDEDRLVVAGQLQRRLLDGVPVVVPYFPSSLRMASVRATGVDASPWGYLDLTQAALA
jgi:peptide/nickel transport system substrate-binding protein